MSTRTSRTGFTLIEMLSYIGTLTIVMAMAYGAYYRVDRHSRGLTRVADDVARAIRVGERWRSDIRGAVRNPEADATILRIPQSDRVVSYKVENGAVLRRAGAEAPWREVLDGVKVSTMAQQTRNGVSAWRWELELQPHRKQPRTRPLFTFMAVPSEAGEEVAP